ncbi:unnamed protein product [Dicrocoelium dendriticum]|nr:unnamed protein product [Dicrocoelium dendriticum]
MSDYHASNCRFHRAQFNRIWVDIDSRYNVSLGTITLTAIGTKLLQRSVLFRSDISCHFLMEDNCGIEKHGSYYTYSHLVPIYADFPQFND